MSNYFSLFNLRLLAARLTTVTGEKKRHGLLTAAGHYTYFSYLRKLAQGHKYRKVNCQLTDAHGEGFAAGGLKVKPSRAGDEEGAVELVIIKAHGDQLPSVNLLISEASD